MKKKLLLVQGSIYAAIAIAMLFFPLMYDLDTFGLVVWIPFVLLFSFLSYKHFKEARTVSDDEKPYGPPAGASKAEKILFYKKGIILAVPVFTILSIWCIFDLNNINGGDTPFIDHWVIVWLAYDMGGYWPAALITPAIGIFVIIRCIVMIQKISKEK